MQEQDNKPKDKKSNVFAAFRDIGGISGWLRALLGKKSPQKPERTQDFAQIQVKEAPEDSIVQDIKSLKTFLGKKLQRSQSKLKTGSEGLGPMVYRQKSLARKATRGFLALLFLLILIFVTHRFIRVIQEDGRGKGKNYTTQESPTPAASYRPYKASIYAEDPEVLKLEEDLNVIERELGRTIIREDSLLPPRLDFDIGFNP